MKPSAKLELFTPAQLQKVFVNDRGEAVNTKVALLNDERQGIVWRTWAARYFPAEIFRTFRMLDASGSEEWLNVAEHCIFVAAASLTLARQIEAAGQALDKDMIIQAAMVHDAAKRIDVEHRKSRESESYDTLLANELILHGYSFEVVIAALNTGRTADRYIIDPRIRMDHIRHKGPEAAIVGYCDARIRGSHIYSLHAAKEANLLAKTRPDDIKFFSHYWWSYYKAVESYLRHLCPHLDPASLTDEAIYQTISQEVAKHGRTTQGRSVSS
jgi:hypothetical protein